MSAVYELPVQAPFRQTFQTSHPPAETRVSENGFHPSSGNQTNLQMQMLLESIESLGIREVVEPVLSDLLRLQDCLHLFESHLRRIEQAHETLAMFGLVHVEAHSVVNDIRSLTMRTNGVDESLLETLDGIAFAIGHDLHRVFEYQLNQLTDHSPAELVIGELVHGHGLLTNCIQESIVALAQEFDPTITSARLFENFKARLTESLVLCRDLTELIQFVRGWAEAHTGVSASSIVEQVMKFRRGSLHLLMYRDWQEYERFSAKITLASGDSKALGPVLDSFACYLETLLRLVSSRSVLSGLASQSLPSEVECMPLEQYCQTLQNAQWHVTRSAGAAASLNGV